MGNVNRLLFCDARGSLNQINDVLGGKNGKLWLDGINSYLRQGAIKAFGWKIYGYFNLRLFESPTVLMAAINYKLKLKTIFQGNDYDIEVLINQIQSPIKEEVVKFVFLTVKELGFDNMTTLSEIEDCLPDLGLSLCDQSDAPRLFLSNEDDLKKIREMDEAFFVSKPFFRHLRSKEDPERPFLFSISFYQEGVSLNNKWRENLDTINGGYLLDMLFYPSDKIILRIKN